MNHEEPMNGHREVAWLDTLTDQEQKHVQRLSEMPTSMAVGYVWVDFNRQMDDLREEHLAGAKEIAHHVHAVHQRALNDVQRAGVAPRNARLFRISHHMGVDALDQGVLQAFFDG